MINIGNFYNQLIACSAYRKASSRNARRHAGDHNKPDAADLPGDLRGRVDFNDVVFRYEKDGRNILNLVDFHVEPGHTIGAGRPDERQQNGDVACYRASTTCPRGR